MNLFSSVIALIALSATVFADPIPFKQSLIGKLPNQLFVQKKEAAPVERAQPEVNLDEEDQTLITVLLFNYIEHQATYANALAYVKDVTKNFVDPAKHQELEPKSIALLKPLKKLAAEDAEHVVEVLWPAIKEAGNLGFENPYVDYSFMPQSMTMKFFENQAAVEKKEDPEVIVNLALVTFNRGQKVTLGIVFKREGKK